MGAVTYSGTGKYMSGKDRMVLWGDIPGQARVFDEGAPVPAPAYMDQLISPADEEKNITAPDGKGWWPVCWVSWKNEAEDNRFSGFESDYHSGQLPGEVLVWIICWYQLFDKGWILVLWPTYLHSRL